MTNRARTTAFVRLAGLVLAMAAAMATSASGSPGPRARSARTLSASDTAHLRYNPRDSEGSMLVEEGSATGQLPGRMLTHLNVGATFAGSFVLYTRGGSIKGHGSAKPSGSGRYESFRGSLVVTGGTGRYGRAHGRAGLYGVFDRKTYELTIQTTGRLSY